MGEKVMRQIEKVVSLSAIDSLWMDHLDAMMNFRQGVGLRAYGQKDPLVEYKNESFRMFEKLVNGIDDEIVHRIFKIHLHQAPQTNDPLHRHGVTEIAAGANSNREVSTGATSSSPSVSVSTSSASASSPSPAKKKLGRNDPCWCGSGKKYKKCHYPN